MKRGSTLRVFVFSAIAWVFVAPFVFTGAVAALLLWPVRCGFLAVWRSLED